MTSAEMVELDFCRRLSDGLRCIASAQGRNAILAATAQAAHEFGRADGLCVLPSDHSNYLVMAAQDSRVLCLESGSSLQRLVASVADSRDAIVQHRSDMEVQLPGGWRRAQTVLTVPLGPASTYLAIAFFWHDGVAPSAEQLALLSGLAWTCKLALQAQHREEDLQRTQQQQRLQIIELQHRARNVLAVVRSIIRRSSDTAESTEEFASHLEARISALARTQGALIIDGRAGPELEDLIRSELAANAVRDSQFVIAGPAMRLSTRAAETMALTLHELTTNALKFGALTAPAGHIAVSWSIDSSATPPRLHWRWIESGVGMAHAEPHRRGFGQELIERVLPYELGARTAFSLAPGGVHCEIDLPLNERTTSFGEIQHERNRGGPP
jgi:two-component sensor histidine kinase